MRGLYGYSAALMGIAAAQIEGLRYIAMDTGRTHEDFSSPKRRRTSETYPHSSKRQQERFARQLAAGQVKFTA